MEIKFKFRGKFYSVCIGYETPWFSQLPFLTISREEYEGKLGEVTWAELLFYI